MARKARRVTLIHNPTAGNANHSLPAIAKLIKRAGYRVTAVSIKDGNLDRVLDAPGDLIAIAGGDGTIKRVVCEVKPDGPALAILPLGTANNIAAALGFTGSMEALIGSWEVAKLHPFYRFDAEGPWGHACIVEGIGFGCIAQAIDEIEASKPSVADAQKRIAQSILTSTAEELDLWLQSETLSGRFALLELTNIPLVGPHLHLAPMADPSEPLIHASFLEDQKDRRLEFSKWLLRADTDVAAPVTTWDIRRRATPAIAIPTTVTTMVTNNSYGNRAENVRQTRLKRNRPPRNRRGPSCNL